MTLPKLIVIDDEADLASFVCDVAEQAGFDAEQFNSADAFRKQYDQSASIIVLDLIMPEVDGIEIIRFLAEIHSDALLILMSGFDSGVLHSAQKLAVEQGLNIVGSLNKPFRHDELHQLLCQFSVTPKNHNNNTKSEQISADELSDAMVNNGIVVYYQPKVALHGHAEACVEALVRYQRPNGDLIMPDFFIPTAEQYNLIDNLTWLVLTQVMQQCQAWREQGLSIQVAVNMSSNTLKDLNLPEKMGRLLQKYDLPPSQIVLEVTETVLMQELTKSLDILTRLRMKGFHLSIDDFGTGYSSMVQLHRAPFSEIKIDRSFIAEMEDDSEAATIVETIIMLGHKLNMKVVAEGVETESCHKKLTRLFCDQAQGYFFARPMPGYKIFSWFSQRL